MATIMLRGKKWAAKIRRKGYPTVQKSFPSKEDAEKWARKTESEIERGLYIEDLEGARTTTVAGAAARFEEEHLASLADPQRQKNRLAALLERTKWGSLSLVSLRGRQVAAYVRQREKDGCRPNTIRLDLALLSGLFKHARQEWGMESLRNPVDSVRRPSLRGTARTRRLELGEEENLLKAAHDDLRPVIRFAIETAMRREEIALLSWENVDLEKRTAYLPKTKNGEARTVPLSSRAIAVLQAMADGEKGPVFGLTKNQITDRMRVAVHRAGIEDLRFHDLRHEATSRLFERGTLDMMEIASITGHKTLHMLKRYTHLRAEDLARKLR